LTRTIDATATSSSTNRSYSSARSFGVADDGGAARRWILIADTADSREDAKSSSNNADIIASPSSVAVDVDDDDGMLRPIPFFRSRTSLARCTSDPEGAADHADDDDVGVVVFTAGGTTIDRP
jgi:hypothetical protein